MFEKEGICVRKRVYVCRIGCTINMWEINVYKLCIIVVYNDN